METSTTTARLHSRRDLLASMCADMEAHEAFDSRDVDVARRALNRTETLLEAEQQSMIRQKRYSAMLGRLREQLQERQTLLRSYESRGLDVGELKELHEHFCRRQDEIRGMVAEVEAYVDTGELPSVAASSAVVSATI